MKKLTSFLLTLCMILSIAPASVFADTTEFNSINVNVTIAQNGQFVTGNDKKIAYIPIEVADRNKDSKYDIDEVLYATHEAYYEGGAASGYASAETAYGLSLAKLWGDESGSFGYYVNNSSAWSLGDAVEDGDHIYAFIYQDTTGWSDEYSFFESDAATINYGDSLKLKLQKNGYDEDYNTVISAVQNATVTVNGSVTSYQTNEVGEVEMRFSKSGTYIVSAVPEDGYLVPPVCIVTVKEYAKTQEINEALENISATYKNKTDEWTVMDMGAYEKYAPQTENKLTDEARQTFINSAIKTIKDPTASLDTDIDKAVLGLIAIGKNPELLYSVNSNTPISAIEKLNRVEQSTSAWRAPYTLSAYNQGEYKTDIYETTLVDAFLESQQVNGSWDEFGTIDTTANVIAGLSFYKDSPEVRDAIDKAVNYLSTQQTENGTFSDGYSGPNSNSTAMVIIGLCAAGVDLVNDTRFIKNGNNIIDGMLSFLVADKNGFGHTDNASINSYSTEQAFRALIALAQRINTGEAYNIYDFSKNELTPARETGTSTSSSTPSEPTGDNITVTMTIKADTGYWLNNYSTTIPGDGATVYDAFIKACADRNITHTGAANGYVSSITKGNITLGEFDKGENSGWLYKVNGELPQVGLTDCSIKNGDNIVWYYTEDWTKDPSASHYGGSSSVSNKVENNIVTTTTKVSGEKATVTAKESSIKNAISNAEKNNNASVVIAPTDTKNATNITLEIPVNSIKEIADSKGLSLSVETTAGNVDISNETLNALAKQCGDSKSLSVAIEKKTADDIAENTEAISSDALKNASIIEVTIKSQDTSIHTFDGNTLSVYVPVSENIHEKGKTYKTYIISSDGSIDTAYGECVEKDGELSVKVQTNHLSAFVVTDEEKSVFTDIADHWAVDAIEYVYNNSIMEGVSKTTFAPDDTMTRAEFAAITVRALGLPIKFNNTFTDVTENDWFYSYVNTAYYYGIVNGVSDAEFNPSGTITREEAAVMVARAAKLCGMNTDIEVLEARDILAGFLDYVKASDWAVGSLAFCYDNEILPNDAMEIKPKESVTRAEIAQMLYNMLMVSRLI